MDSLTPGQQVIKIVRDELTNLLGGSASTLTFVRGQSAFMLVGLQGSGKTTTTVKLARMLKAKEKNPVVISLDTYRPAAGAVGNCRRSGRHSLLSSSGHCAWGIGGEGPVLGKEVRTRLCFFRHRWPHAPG